MKTKNTLIFSMGEEADGTVGSFGFTSIGKVVKGKFESHFVVKRNVIL